MDELTLYLGVARVIAEIVFVGAACYYLVKVSRALINWMGEGDKDD